MTRMIQLLLFVSVIGCNASNPLSSIQTPGPIQSETSILFIGNSLSYYNDLPDLLTKIAEAYGQDLGADCHCLGNYALVDHWNDGIIKALIANNQYDYIFMQQGPSSQPEGRGLLLEYGEVITSFADEYGTKSGFYMVWPSVTYYHTFDGVIESYTMAAEQTGSLLLPVGKVWQEYAEREGFESLYSGDFFHPSLKGSFLAAWVMFRTLNPSVDIEYKSEFSLYMNSSDFALVNEIMDGSS